MIFRYQIEETITVKDYLIQNKIPSNVLTSLKSSNGQILVNDQSVTMIYLMHKGDLLEVVFPSSSQGENIKSVKGDLDILYEDSYLLIVNKPNNLATIPTRKHYNNSLANYIMSYYLQKGIEANIHFVSRLDSPTSGIIILAKNSYMLTLLQQTNIIKHYILEVKGIIENDKGLIELGIEKDPNSIIKRRITNEYINSRTEYSVISRNNNTTIIDALLCTGKTHQLRLHFSYLGHPIIGDLLYDEENYSEQEILRLHSYYVSFVHPITKKQIEIKNYPIWYKKTS